MDFYYPFLKRWAERVRSATSVEKVVFLEAVPNEVCACVRGSLGSDMMLLASFVLSLGRQTASSQIWSMPPIGEASTLARLAGLTSVTW